MCLEKESLGDETKFAELCEAENDLLNDYISNKIPHLSENHLKKII